MNPLARIRLLELLADRALEGLNSWEQGELAELLAAFPDVDPNSMDLAAALIAATDPEQAQDSLPDELRRRIEERASTLPPFTGKTTPARHGRLSPRLRRAVLAWGGWAMAACLLIGVGGYWISNREPTPAQKFERFLADAGALVRAKGGAPDPKTKPNVAGEIYWSGKRQEGYMKLRGLPVNNPKEKQYQLWIFDKQRDERHPVDGGVFNINAEGEAVIPIDARVPIHNATLFVITREPPGGVVVSDRKEIVLVASLK